MNLDPILYWNDVALEVHRRDFTANHDGDSKVQGKLAPEHGGPTRTSRALAIVHVAMYEAYRQTVTTSGLQAYPIPPLPVVPTGGDSSAAVASAAICTLSALYVNSAQRQFIVDKGRDYLCGIARAHEVNDVPVPAAAANAIRIGVNFGDAVGVAVLALRKNDDSDAAGWYLPGHARGQHREDPYSPGQGYTGSRWGRVRAFALTSTDHTQYLAPHPPLGSTAYDLDFADVKAKGVGRIMSTSTSVTAATRTAEETVIGIFWGYDGARGLGTPPRLYNQCARAAVAEHLGTPRYGTADYARLFALLNVGMADAAVVAWAAKYHYNLWRPVIGIREHDLGFGPGDASTPPAVRLGDPCWGPLGAPQSNSPGAFNATPDFPAYPSGHATFGGMVFKILERFFGADLDFTFVSDELDGKTLDPDGSLRTRHVRRLRFRQAAKENGRSRVYLGVHWQFDADGGTAPGGLGIGGVQAGVKIADEIFASHFKKAGMSAAAKSPPAASAKAKAKAEGSKKTKDS